MNAIRPKRSAKLTEIMSFIWSANDKSPAEAGLLYGAGCVTRTRDLMITNQLLYRLS